MMPDPSGSTPLPELGNPRLAMAGVIGLPLYVLSFTLAGTLRPGYSAIHQTISDLGIGPNFWLVDGASVLNGMLLIGLVLAFFQRTRTILSARSRWLCSALLMLSPVGLIVAGLFTEAPSTLLVHATLGAVPGLMGPVGAFSVTGLMLRRSRGGRAWGTRLIIAALLTLVLDVVLGYVFTPGTALAAARLGGLGERAALVEILAWYTALGWTLSSSDWPDSSNPRSLIGASA